MAGNLLPLLLIGGGAVYIATAGKKKKKTVSAHVFDKGTYKYTANCQQMWIGGVEIRDMAKITSQEQAPPGYVEAVQRFADETLKPAIRAELQRPRDKEFPILMIGINVTNALVPQCTVALKGKAAKPVGVAMVSLVLSMLPVILVNEGEYTMVGVTTQLNAEFAELMKRGLKGAFEEAMESGALGDRTARSPMPRERPLAFKVAARI